MSADDIIGGDNRDKDVQALLSLVESSAPELLLDEQSSMFLHFVSQVNSEIISSAKSSPVTTSTAALATEPRSEDYHHPEIIVEQAIVPTINSQHRTNQSIPLSITTNVTFNSKVSPTLLVNNKSNVPTTANSRLKISDLSPVQCEILIWKYFLGKPIPPQSSLKPVTSSSSLITSTHSSDTQTHIQSTPSPTTISQNNSPVFQSLKINNEALLGISTVEDLTNKLGIPMKQFMSKAKQKRIVESLQCWREINQGYLPKEVSDYIIKHSPTMPLVAETYHQTAAPLLAENDNLGQKSSPNQTLMGFIRQVDSEDMAASTSAPDPVVASSTSLSNSISFDEELPATTKPKESRSKGHRRSRDSSGSIDSVDQHGFKNNDEELPTKRLATSALSDILIVREFIQAANTVDSVIIPASMSHASAMRSSTLDWLKRLERLLSHSVKYIGSVLRSATSNTSYAVIATVDEIKLELPNICRCFKILSLKLLALLRSTFQSLHRGGESSSSLSIDIDTMRCNIRDCLHRMVIKTLSAIHWMLVKKDTSHEMLKALFLHDGMDLLWNEISILVSTANAMSDVLHVPTTGIASIRLLRTSDREENTNKMKIVENAISSGGHRDLGYSRSLFEMDIMVMFLRILCILVTHPCIECVTRSSFQTTSISQGDKQPLQQCKKESSYQLVIFPTRCENLLSLLCTYYILPDDVSNNSVMKYNIELTERLCHILYHLTSHSDVCRKILTSSCISEHDRYSYSCPDLLMKVLNYYSSTNCHSNSPGGSNSKSCVIEEEQHILPYLCGLICKFLRCSLPIGESCDVSKLIGGSNITVFANKFIELGLCESILKLLKKEVMLTLSFSTDSSVHDKIMTAPDAAMTPSEIISHREKQLKLIYSAIDQILSTVGIIAAASEPFGQRRLNHAGVGELLTDILRGYANMPPSTLVATNEFCCKTIESICSVMWIVMEKDSSQDEENRSSLTKTSIGCEILLQVLQKYTALLQSLELSTSTSCENTQNNRELHQQRETAQQCDKKLIIGAIRQISGATAMKLLKSPASASFFLWYNHRESGGLCKLFFQILSLLNIEQSANDGGQNKDIVFYCLKILNSLYLVNSSATTHSPFKPDVMKVESLVESDALIIESVQVLINILYRFKQEERGVTKKLLIQSSRDVDIIILTCSLLTRVFSCLSSRLETSNCGLIEANLQLISTIQDKETTIMDCILSLLNQLCEKDVSNSEIEHEDQVNMSAAILLLWKHLRMVFPNLSRPNDTNVAHSVKLFHQKCLLASKAFNFYNHKQILMPNPLLSLWCWNIRTVASLFSMRSDASRQLSIHWALNSGRDIMTNVAISILIQIRLHSTDGGSNIDIDSFTNENKTESVVCLLSSLHNLLLVSTATLVPSILIQLTIASGKYHEPSSFCPNHSSTATISTSLSMTSFHNSNTQRSVLSSPVFMRDSDDFLSDFLLPICTHFPQDSHVIKHALLILSLFLTHILSPVQSRHSGSLPPSLIDTPTTATSINHDSGDEDDLCFLFLQASPRAIHSLSSILASSMIAHVFNKPVLLVWCEVVLCCLNSSFFCDSHNTTTSNGKGNNLNGYSTGILVQVTAKPTAPLQEETEEKEEEKRRRGIDQEMEDKVIKSSSRRDTVLEIASFSSLLLACLQQVSLYMHEAMSHFYYLEAINTDTSEGTLSVVEMLKKIFNTLRRSSVAHDDK